MIEVPKPCLKCGKIGIEKYAEILPKKAALIKVVHNDGSEPCEFEEYSSISTFLNSRIAKDPKIMNCPVCGKKGRICWYRLNKAKNAHRWKYYIFHEEIPGYWGKSKIKKHRRCYVNKEAQRVQVLKQLGENQL
jgi:hypothetical protein